MIGMGTNALASSIVLVCRKRNTSAPSIPRRQFLRELKEELPEALETMIGGKEGATAIAPVDLAQAAIGPGMAIYSRYSGIIEADGSKMSVKDALIQINKVIDEFFNEAEGDMDSDTRFCIDWFMQYGFKTDAFGQADVLARAKGTTVDYDFAEKVTEISSKQLIEALNDLIRDFNEKLTEQFGDNFRRLDESVGKLLEWQENYKQQLAEMKQQYDLSVQSIEECKSSLASIRQDSERIPETMNQLQTIMTTADAQLSDLERHLEAFKEMKEKAVEAMPAIKEQLDQTMESIQGSVSQATHQYNQLLADSNEFLNDFKNSSNELQTRFVDQTTDMIDWITAHLKDTANDIVSNNENALEILQTGMNQMEKVAGSIGQSVADTEKQLNQLITDVSTRTNDQIQASFQEQNRHIQQLSSSLSGELTRAAREREDMLNKALQGLDQQDHGPGFENARQDPASGRKFHVADCKTLKDMRERNRFERYIATRNMSGVFKISGFNFAGQEETAEVPLLVCKNCLNFLNYKGYRNKSGRERNRIVREFDLEDFFSTYSSYFEQLPFYTDETIPDTITYGDDWPEIAHRYKVSQNWMCEECGVKLDQSQFRKFLHAHHKNGVKHDHDENNLQALCIDCHSKKPQHRLFVVRKIRLLINRLRNQQSAQGGEHVKSSLKSKDWDEIIDLADPAVHGLVDLCQSHSHALPEVGLDIMQKSQILTQVELAWERKRIGVVLQKDETTERIEELGWQVYTPQEAMQQWFDSVR